MSPAEARRRKVLAMLARGHGVRYAVLVEDPNTDPVVHAAGGEIGLSDGGLVMTDSLPDDLMDRIKAHHTDIVLELGAEDYFAFLRTMSPHPMSRLFPLLTSPSRTCARQSPPMVSVSPSSPTRGRSWTAGTAWRRVSRPVPFLGSGNGTGRTLSPSFLTRTCTAATWMNRSGRWWRRVWRPCREGRISIPKFRHAPRVKPGRY